MKKICIAIDFSPSSEKIATIGYQYAKALNAEIILVHAIYEAAYYSTDYDPIMGYDGFLIRSSIQFVEDLKNEAHKFLDATIKHLGDKSIKTFILEGETANAILNFANEQKVDLLVIGTHSHSKLENLFMGNIAVSIVKNSTIPMLIIPTKEK